jgi:hypothetical protein
MRISNVRQHLILAVLLLVSTACQSGTPQAHNTPKPSVSPSATADAQRCVRLAKRGFTPCPPLASQLKLPPTTIKNATNGAVDDATVQKWGRAFQLGQAYYYWVVTQNARDALTSGVLADTAATDNLFSPDLQDLDQASQGGGRLVVQFLDVPLTQVVLVPSDLQDAIRRQGMTPKPFALVNRFVGPSSRRVVYPDGHEQTLASVDGTFTAYSITWGEFRSDPDLGNIWYDYGYYGCEGSVKSVCQI